ncbi:MAG: ABC transporter permease [Candidatus Omnitrophica bacterium]|nr:ABC transporter permease [Candidatus Omnitrophota bacterium]
MTNNLMITGIVMVGVLAVMVLLAPVICRHDPVSINIERALLAPSKAHIFGTDYLGRDIFSRVIYGGRVSMLTGLVAIIIALIIGLVVGSIAGYYGGITDLALMGIVDIMLCFPAFFIVLAVVAMLEPGIINIMVIIGLTSWMPVARLVRAEILSLKNREFILVSKAFGSSSARIIFRHLIPNAIAPVLVSAVFGVAGAVLLESSLSFLGLGIQPPSPSWGNILMEGKASLGACWWPTVFPGLFILITVLGFNMIGEGLREHFMPYKI